MKLNFQQPKMGKFLPIKETCLGEGKKSSKRFGKLKIKLRISGKIYLN